MACGVTATTYRLIAMLFGMAQATSFAAEGTTKGRDFVRVVSDQMHQLEVVKVEPYAFLDQRSAIGQISFNEDATTIVVTPFSGRVIRLIAKVGDQVRRGDPLLEIDSAEQVAPQNEFIAAQTARNKARSQLNLAQIVEKRVRDLYEGKAAPFKELQQAEAQLAAAESDMRSTDTAFEAARVRLRILGRTDAEIATLEQQGTLSRVTRITRADRWHRDRAQGRARTICQSRFWRGAIYDRRPLDDVAEGRRSSSRISRLCVSARRSRPRFWRRRTGSSRRVSTRSTRRPT